LKHSQSRRRAVRGGVCSVCCCVGGGGALFYSMFDCCCRYYYYFCTARICFFFSSHSTSLQPPTLFLFRFRFHFLCSFARSSPLSVRVFNSRTHSSITPPPLLSALPHYCNGLSLVPVCECQSLRASERLESGLDGGSAASGGGSVAAVAVSSTGTVADWPMLASGEDTTGSGDVRATTDQTNT